ncbi:MAG TPA: SusC/RagA family TonB-linked outer membrane protein, partial [Dysgonomonas sp.]|nr:SusC/RagA family TonB-linked outer membrane protein [Dysgonomonas sp.]
MNKKTKSRIEKTKNSFFRKVLNSVLLFFIVNIGTNMYAANAYSQSTSMSVKLSNVKVETLFSEIEKNSDYVILYKKGIVEDKTVTVNSQNESPEEILDKALPSVGLTYYVNGNQIVVVENNSPALETMETQEVQQAAIQARGVVYDSSNTPLIGVSILEKAHPTNGVATGLDGDFSLNVQPGAILVISYVGYTTREVPVPADGNIGNIVLTEDSQILQDVVVVGYGVQKKVNLTGSISSVSTKDLQGRTNTNLLQSLQGTAPGVTIISRPGQNPSINVRGRGNLGTSSPLYVIDGAISTSDAFANLDPNSIENISILKDAASASIYGSRAAYGVVLVTTKQGTHEGFQINYSGLIGFKEQTTKPKVVSSEWEAILSNEAQRNIGQTSNLVSDETIELLRNGSQPDLYPNTDWWDLLFDDNRVTTNHTLSFSGSSAKTNYYASIGYTYDDSFRYGESYDRYNVNTNLSSQLNSWLKIRTGVRYAEEQRDQAGAFSLAYLMQSSPSYVARQSNGWWGTVQRGGNAVSTFVTRNPLRVAEEGGWQERNRKFLTIDGAVDITLYKGLVFTGSMISDWSDYKQKQYTAFMPGVPRFLDDGATTIGEVAQSESKMEYNWEDRRRLMYNALLNYDWTNNAHTVKVMLGTSYEHYKYQQQRSLRKNFPTNNMEGMNGGSSTAADSEAYGPLYEDKMMSYFGRINYDYRGKYLFEANMRADASSRFHKDHRWGYFPSFSAGWRMSEEAFMNDVTWIDNLKVRASWGQLGNIENVGRYDYFAAYSVGENNYNFGNTSGSSVRENKIPNAMLGWETVTMTNIGLDFDLFSNRLNFSGDWYIKKTSDILLEYDVLSEVGAANKVSQNIGKMQNKGIELSISHNNRIGDFSYTVSGNFSKNWNEITYLGRSEER